MHFYASIFFKCQNFCVFWSNFPAKIIQNHKIISFETFWKSLTRLSRLLKVLSWPRLSRLANANANVILKYTIYLIFACYKISKASWLSVKAKAKRPFLKVRIVSYGPKYQYLFLITFMLSLSKVKLFSGQLTYPKLPFFSFIFRWLHWK